MYQTSLTYQPTLESHMMKNTEWGAVAYLSHSIYGTCDKEAKKCTEVMINNSQNYVTGVSAKERPTIGYNEYKEYTNTTPGTANEKSNVYSESVEASTTKNNTGIFDMSGGAWEYVMGIKLTNESNQPPTITSLSEKYYDKYIVSTGGHYSLRILGDATGEMGPFANMKLNTGNRETETIGSWFKDASYFGVVSSSSAYFLRGRQYLGGVNAGMFAFSALSGDANESAFRIVLAPATNQ